MDCNRLKADIEQLITLKQVLEKTLSKNNENFRECAVAKNQLEDFYESVFAEYSDDLYEHNRELFVGHIKKESIEGLEDSQVTFYDHQLSLLQNGDVIISGFDNGAWVYHAQTGEADKAQTIEDAKTVNGGTNCIVLNNGDIIMSCVSLQKTETFICERQDDGSYRRNRKLDTVTTPSGAPLIITAVAQISDSVFIFCGITIDDSGRGVECLAEYERDSDGNYHAIRDLSSPELRPDATNCLYLLPSGELVTIGADCIFEYKKGPDGSFQHVEEVPLSGVRDSHLLPNGNILISCYNSRDLYEYRSWPDGTSELVTKSIQERLDFYGFDKSVGLPNGDVLVAGRGSLFIYKLQSDGNYRLSEKIASFSDTLVNSMLLLPSGDVLIGTDSLEIYELKLDNNGDYRLSEPIKDLPARPDDMLLLPNGDVMISGGNGLFTYSMKPKPEEIRGALDKIAAKK